MHTYWLTCRDGPITMTNYNHWNHDIVPAYTDASMIENNHYYEQINNQKVKL